MPRMLTPRATWKAALKPQNEALDVELTAQIATAWTIARPLLRQANRLRRKLADPALATHTKRPDAEAALADLDRRINQEMRTVAQSWQLLSASGCAALVVDGWPHAASGIEFANQLRRDIALGEPYRWPVNQGER